MEQSQSTAINIFRNPIHFIAYGFGAGLLPKAPGTFGSLMAIPFYLLLRHMPISYYLAWLIGTSLFGIWICHITARDIEADDPAGIVWDEMVGYWVSLFLMPPGLMWIILGFILFRLFDILKPWPISWIERGIKGGLGIMLDDILAGAFTCLTLHGITYLFLHP